jgi:hypothetical protein
MRRSSEWVRFHHLHRKKEEGEKKRLLEIEKYNFKNRSDGWDSSNSRYRNYFRKSRDGQVVRTTQGLSRKK